MGSVSVGTHVSGLAVEPARPVGVASGVPVLFGVVVFDGVGRRVRETVAVFGSAADADSFARVQGLADYEVCGLRLVVTDTVVSVAGRPLHGCAGSGGGR